MNIISLFIVFTITNVIYGIVAWGVISKIIPSERTLIKALIGISCTTAFTTLMLYYLLFLLPGYSDSFYFITISFLWVILGFFLRKEIGKNLNFLIRSINNNFLISGLFFTLLSFFIVFLCLYILKRPITEHDTFEYAIQGKIFFDEKLIEYVPHRFNESNSFYYVGLHGFSFPLILTWENISNFSPHFSNLYFKFISGWYSLLLLIFSFGILRKINLISGVIGTLIIALTYGFVLASIKFHIDTFRILFLVVSVYLMMKFILEKDNRLLWLCAVTCGLNSFVHSSGVFLSGALFISAFVFYKEDWIPKLKLFLVAGIVFLFFGGIHYLLDIFIGTGWIFKDLALDYIDNGNQK